MEQDKKIQFDKINQIILKNIPDTDAIYIFGSFLTSFFQQDSDIDIAFLAQKPILNKLRWDVSNQLATVLNRDVDLIDLSSASTVMRFQVISTGKRIFLNHKPEIEKFEDLCYTMYLTLNDDRKEILKSIQTSGKIYD